MIIVKKSLYSLKRQEQEEMILSYLTGWGNKKSNSEGEQIREEPWKSCQLSKHQIMNNAETAQPDKTLC